MKQSPESAGGDEGPGLVDQSKGLTNARNEYIENGYPEVEFTLGIDGEGKPQSKIHSKGADGKVKTAPPDFSSRGTLRHVRCTLDALPEEFREPGAFMILGTPKGSSVGETRELTLAALETGDAIARTLENFEFAAGGTYPLLIDVDIKSEHCVPPMPSGMGPMDVLKPINSALKSVGAEGLTSTAMIVRSSSSAGITFEDGTPAKDSDGWHIFIPLKGKTPDQVLGFLHKQLVMRGFGYAYVAANGVVDIRTFIDAKVGGANRVSFEAPPILRDGLKRKPKSDKRSGRVLDLTDVDLNVDESEFKARCDALESALGVKELVAERRTLYVEKQFHKGVSEGLSEEQARSRAQRLATDRNRFDLYPKDGVVFRFDDGREATISDILQDPAEYHDYPLMDPADLKERPGKAKFYWNQKQGALGQEQFIINLIRSGQTIFLHGEDVDGREPVDAPVSADAEMIDTVRRLAGLGELDYDRVRGKEAEALGVRVTKLDKAVSLERDRLIADDTDDSDGRRPATLNNVVKSLKNPSVCGIEVAFDEFTATQVWTPTGGHEWQEWTDAKSVEMRMHLAASGLKEVSKDIMRDALVQAADSNRIDTAQIWANKLPAWDRAPRCESFFIDHFGARDTHYARAIGLYTWSALAGRIVTPGVKADMIPALIGAQGARKSSGVEAMAPTRETFVEINLHDKEDDLKRNMVGALIGEIGELAGFNKREMDWFKSFLVRKVEQWIPKWCERSITYKRRLLMIATTNEERFLRDATGERRWLPLRVGAVDVNGIVENRDQLWAEALEIYSKNGIMFGDAERLAEKVVARHKEECPDADLIQDWLDRESSQFGASAKGKPRDWPFIKTADVGQAIGIENKDLERNKHRISKAMRLLGYKSDKQRFIPGGRPFNAWVKPE